MSWVDGTGRPLAGTLVAERDLRGLGFAPLLLQMRREPVSLPCGTGCSWTTLGDVPDSPGLYASTVSNGDVHHVTYVGLTRHLWMVTKGCVPRSGGARPGQRYGRPKYAGVTRQRVNVLVTAEVAAGRTVRHWVCPKPAGELAAAEEALIVKWQLRQKGWNRG